MLGYYKRGIVFADSSKAGNFITEKMYVNFPRNNSDP
jgi:hypothetical protein